MLCNPDKTRFTLVAYGFSCSAITQSEAQAPSARCGGRSPKSQ